MEAQQVETHHKNYHFWLLVVVAYLTIGLMGLTELASLVAFPLLRDYYKAPADQYGLFVSIFGGCYLLGCFLSSLILKKWGFKTLYVVAYLMDIVGCLLLQFSVNFFMACVCLFLVGTSQGFFEISTNSVATSLFKTHTATWMMFMQTCFGIGATVSPMLCKWSVHLLHRDFFSCYLMVAAIVFLGFIFICFIDIRPELCNTESDKDVEAQPSLRTSSYSWRNTLTTGMCWLCAVTMGMMEGMENGTNNWATLYLVDVLHFDPLKEVATFSTYLQLIFTISRLISGPIIDWIGYYRSLYLSVIGCWVLLLVGFLTGRTGIYFFVFTSFFYAWFWPTNVCVMMGIFKENAPLATSHIFVMQGLFTLPFGYVLGWVNRLYGNCWAYRANLVFGVIALICLTVEYCLDKKRKSAESLLQSQLCVCCSVVLFIHFRVALFIHFRVALFIHFRVALFTRYSIVFIHFRVALFTRFPISAHSIQTDSFHNHTDTPLTP